MFGFEDGGGNEEMEDLKKRMEERRLERGVYLPLLKLITIIR